MRSATIRVLVVDDSTFIRHAIARMLSKYPDIEVVGQARNGEDALAMVRECSPDVMTLDIEMPGMNGLDVLDIIMRECPMPVIMVSSLTEDSAKETFRALELGAVDFISKQLDGSLLTITKIETHLIEKIRAAASSREKIAGLLGTETSRQNHKYFSTVPPETRVAWPRARGHQHAAAHGVDALVVIGSSTGGPKAIQEILAQWPSAFSCSVLVIQHMPKFFTKPFAARLHEQCALAVCEANDGDCLEAGRVFVAPGGRHLRLESHVGQKVLIRISSDLTHLPYRPSVNLAMESAANIFGDSVIGVVLTGMGNDGELGMAAIKTAGGRTLVQDEASCIVYGMPKAVVAAGHADVVVPLSRMHEEIHKCLVRLIEHQSARSLEVCG